MIGSWWAYYELGWGGWWFWDPSENASLMPWLAGTALVHSLVVTERRGALKVWTVFLSLGAFSLSLVGTFLVRSGVLSSVHAFAQDPLRGLFILIFLAIVIGGSLALFARRASVVKAAGEGGATPGDFQPVSRETAILTGNVLLLVALATVLLGTLYPLVLDAFDLGKVSVGPPYFNAVFVPLMVPVLLLLGVGAALALARNPHGRCRARLALAGVGGVAGCGSPAFCLRRLQVAGLTGSGSGGLDDPGDAWRPRGARSRSWFPVSQRDRHGLCARGPGRRRCGHRTGVGVSKRKHRLDAPGRPRVPGGLRIHLRGRDRSSRLELLRHARHAATPSRRQGDGDLAA
jgi:hypothetical protein